MHIFEASGEIIEVPDKLIKAWAQRRAAAGLSSFNERAELSQYPDVIAKLIERHAARKDPLASRVHKDLLSDQIKQIMDEVLVPLATEISTASAYEQASKEAELTSRREILAARIQNLLMEPQQARRHHQSGCHKRHPDFRIRFIALLRYRS